MRQVDLSNPRQKLKLFASPVAPAQHADGDYSNGSSMKGRSERTLTGLTVTSDEGDEGIPLLKRVRLLRNCVRNQLNVNFFFFSTMSRPCWKYSSISSSQPITKSLATRNELRATASSRHTLDISHSCGSHGSW